MELHLSWPSADPFSPLKGLPQNEMRMTPFFLINAKTDKKYFEQKAVSFKGTDFRKTERCNFAEICPSGLHVVVVYI